MLDFLYEARDSDAAAFGDKWCGPQKFERGEWTLVAQYEQVGGDGHPVKVYCSAMPARFYQIDALPSQNSLKEHQKGFCLETGSGMAELAHAMAKAISEGMLGFRGDHS